MIRNILYSLVISLLFISCTLKSGSSSKPNVIIVLSDDQGWGDIGYNGNQLIETPILDSISKHAVVFTRFYVSPVSVPTTECLLSGKYHVEGLGSKEEYSKGSNHKLHTNIAKSLAAEGYKTAFFGKWNKSNKYSSSARGKGFETSFEICDENREDNFKVKFLHRGKKVETNGYVTDVLTDSVLNFIQNTKDPFFAFVAFSTPHSPYQVPDKYYKKYRLKGLGDKTAAIYGMCENIDDNIYRIQKALLSTAKHSNTVFIYLSENGPDFVRYNGGLKGRKADVDEGGVRVPFLISYPNGHFLERHLRDDFAAHIDIFPTILDLCKLSSESINYDGISFAKILSDSTLHLNDRKFYSLKFIDAQGFAGSVRTNDYLLTCYPADTALYNLSSDPFQMNNIINCKHEVADSLKNDFKKWLTKLAMEDEGLNVEEPVYAKIQLGENKIHEDKNSK